MENVINRIKQTTLSVAEQLTPVLKESKFKECGRITPEEFIAAGDHLVHHCPTWSWAAGDETKAKSYLPKDKQFLITKNVPCLRRCKQMEFSGVERIVEDVEGEEGWVTHDTEGDEDESNENPSEMTLDNSKIDEIRAKNESQNADNNSNDEDDEGEAMDMEDFEESGMLDNVDPSVAIIQPVEKKNPITSESDDSIVHTRTYDLHIVYNKYYQTPHLFLIGYDKDENRKLLTVEEMFEDVSQDNAKKTVTMEQHPHLGPSMLAVHPCRHSDLMKKFIQIAEEGGNELSVHSYLIIFLKFVQSVIPTINYDYSQNITI
ncbi:CLUMA_CG008481, isoform A [Clunio marinus]|uniref:Ubiquitin-like-conjugating enzyme ATG3 n=1 Tax=Clunio marinus TaxID=568069 RepID=A0A1J1I477_9DIPT|nr:CLUMA_CG008481, isoform A [Clunio marinus]